MILRKIRSDDVIEQGDSQGNESTKCYYLSPSDCHVAEFFLDMNIVNYFRLQI